jgi:hypothetical protein
MYSIVYVLSNPAMPGLIKIGMSSNEDATERLGQLYTTGVPFPFHLEFACRVPNPDEVEKALHTAFSPSRVNPRREFFSIDAGQAIAILKLLHVQDATTEIENNAPTPEQQVEINSGQQYKSRRPQLNLESLGIPVGSRLISSTNPDISLEVLANKKVRLGEEDMSLTAATKKVLSLDYAVSPAPYWTHEGTSLQEIYNRSLTEEE